MATRRYIHICRVCDRRSSVAAHFKLAQIGYASITICADAEGCERRQAARREIAADLLKDVPEADYALKGASGKSPGLAYRR